MTIESYYNDYKRCYYVVKNKCRGVNPSHTTWNALPEEIKTLLRENSINQENIMDDMVDLVKLYCRRFPDEKICQYIHFKTYDEYPYRLQQNVPEFMRLL